MSALSLRLPDSLHQAAKELAKRDHISINQFIATAVAEKLAALMTENYITERAAKGSREKFFDILRKAPDVSPEANDSL